MEQAEAEVIIVGAGAAGLMCAIQAARRGMRVILVESKPQVGAKILMSGGTRCNVTNETITEKDYNSRHPKIVRNVLRAFNEKDTLRFFLDLGVELKREVTGKYFPATDSAGTILNALLAEVEERQVRLLKGCVITKIKKDKGIFFVEGSRGLFRADKLVIATGGLSYPGTGSTGFGYEVARQFGHKVVPTAPALTPFSTKEKKWTHLRGVAVESCLTLWCQQRKKRTVTGPLLFTHFGFSGPAVLDMSREWIQHKSDESLEVHVNFLPQWQEPFEKRIIAERFRKTVKNFLLEFLPERLILAILGHVGIAPSHLLSEIRKEDRKRLSKALHAFVLPVAGVLGYSKAEVTSGGVALSELYAATLESRFCPGLYFIGEVCDVDGRIGGFNFQWAWASATVSARAMSAGHSGKSQVKV